MCHYENQILKCENIRPTVPTNDFRFPILGFGVCGNDPSKTVEGLVEAPSVGPEGVLGEETVAEDVTEYVLAD